MANYLNEVNSVEANYFTKLNAIDVSQKVEQKNGLSYLSWAWAWAELKKIHPDAVYTVYENKDGWNYFTDGMTGWVKTGVTVEGVEHIEYLPIMDYRNKSIPAKEITSFDVNKSIQRSLTKAVARHGLGLYIYAGEDLPEETSKLICIACGSPIVPLKTKDKTLQPAEIVERSMKKYGCALCIECAKKKANDDEVKQILSEPGT